MVKPPKEALFSSYITVWDNLDFNRSQLVIHCLSILYCKKNK